MTMLLPWWTIMMRRSLLLVAALICVSNTQGRGVEVPVQILANHRHYHPALHRAGASFVSSGWIGSADNSQDSLSRMNSYFQLRGGSTEKVVKETEEEDDEYEVEYEDEYEEDEVEEEYEEDEGEEEQEQEPIVDATTTAPTTKTSTPTVGASKNEATVETDPGLALSAIKSAGKVQQHEAKVKTQIAKAALNAQLHAPSKSAGSAAMKPRKKKFNLLKALHVPYIIRACLNPFTFFRMTKAYWASLLNPNYLSAKADPAQSLRSAMETKEKRTATSDKKGGGASPRPGKRQMKRGQAKTLSDLPVINTCGA